MCNTSALYLSHLLAEHHPPEPLLRRVPPAKLGHSQTQLECYDNGPCVGIIYLPNESLGRDGLKVLDLADEARICLYEDVSSEEEDTALAAAKGKVEADDDLKAARKKTSQRDGQHSGTIITAITPLNHARHRIEGETLDRLGHRGNDLWRLALKMLQIARQLQPLPIPVPTIRPIPMQTPEQSLPSPSRKSPKCAIVKTLGAVVKTLDIPGFPALGSKKPTPLGSGNPNHGLEPRSKHIFGKNASPPGSTKFPMSSKTSAKSTPAMTASSSMPSMSNGSPPSLVSHPIKQSGPSVRELAANHCQRRAQKSPYRSRLPLGFSVETWALIIAQAVDAEDILSIRQRELVVKYAIDRTTFGRERAWLGQKEGSQVWRVLYGMGCLAYEMDA